MITELNVLSSVRLVAGVQVVADLLLQALFFSLHAGVAHGFVLPGVSLEFTAVNSDVTEFHQASSHGQVHTLREQVRECFPVAGAEPVERPVRRLLITREEPEGDVLNQGSLNFAAAANPDRVSVDPDGDHHPWFKWWPAASFSGVISVDAAQVQVVHELVDEERQVAFRQPVNRSWWQQVRLLRIVITEAFQTQTTRRQEPRSVHAFYHLKAVTDADST